MSGFAVAPPPQQSQEQTPQTPNDLSGILNQWRDLAQQVQKMVQQFPESSPAGVEILRGIQKAMTLISSNPSRVQEKQAPPNG